MNHRRRHVVRSGVMVASLSEHGPGGGGRWPKKCKRLTRFHPTNASVCLQLCEEVIGGGGGGRKNTTWRTSAPIRSLNLFGMVGTMGWLLESGRARAENEVLTGIYIKRRSIVRLCESYNETRGTTAAGKRSSPQRSTRDAFVLNERGRPYIFSVAVSCAWAKESTKKGKLS